MFSLKSVSFLPVYALHGTGRPVGHLVGDFENQRGEGFRDKVVTVTLEPCIPPPNLHVAFQIWDDLEAVMTCCNQ